MKKIETLVEDIYALFNKNVRVTEADTAELGARLGAKIAGKLTDERGPARLRLSNLGAPCKRKLWQEINAPETGEPLDASAKIKFLFGDILEEMLLWLAKMAGHKVEREQETVEVAGVEGHIDAIVDGELLDVKSASSYSFNKFKEHGLKGNDAFGYLTQLNTYAVATDKPRGHFLVVDKTLGKLTLDTWDNEKDAEFYRQEAGRVRELLAAREPPPRHYQDEPDGASGNRKLGIACSYCAFKRRCWPGVRTFIYSNGPRYLTVVRRLPNVPEV